MDLKGTDTMTGLPTTLPAGTEVLPVGTDLADLPGLTRALATFVGDLGEVTAVLDLRATQVRQGSAAIGEVTRWERGLRALERSPATSIALLGPLTQGPALELALACDLRVAEPGSRVQARDEAGVWPGTALYRLVHLLGLGAARRLLLVDGTWDAERSLAAGLVDRVAGDPWAALEELAAGVGEVADLRVVRQLIGEAPSTSYDEALGAHLAACDRFLRRRDAD